MMMLAIINGSIREGLYLERAGYIAAHQISTVILLFLISGYVWILTGRWCPDSARVAWNIGVLWLVLTLCFEFGFGHFIAGRPWEHLLFEYNIAAGRIWILIPLWVLTAPPLMHRMRAQ